MAPGSGDDQSLSLRELARRTGISDGTLRSWARHPERPLRLHRSGRRSVDVTVGELRAFCASHPELPATRTVVANLDSPTATVDAEVLLAVLGTVVSAMRAATAAQLDVVQTSAGQAENSAVICRAHATALAGALDGLDFALALITVRPSERAAEGRASASSAETGSGC
ncbi:MAG: helix-turn-helix transcriptional regulator [Pseudonocardia sp.]